MQSTCRLFCTKFAGELAQYACGRVHVYMYMYMYSRRNAHAHVQCTWTCTHVHCTCACSVHIRTTFGHTVPYVTVQYLFSNMYMYNHDSAPLHGQRGIAGSLQSTLQLSGAAYGDHVGRRFTLWLRCIMYTIFPVIPCATEPLLHCPPSCLGQRTCAALDWCHGFRVWSGNLNVFGLRKP